MSERIEKIESGKAKMLTIDEAKNDMKEIIIYIKTKLNVIDNGITGKSDIRKINVKNF